MKIIKQLTFAGAGTQFNILEGTNLQYAPFSGTVKIGASGSAAGQDTISGYAGSDQFMDACVIGGTNRVPLLPDDFLIIDEVGISGGSQIKLDVTATAARTIWVSVELTEI